jgi:predicted DNA-binding protein (MmcQ/YjbR family)
MGIFSIKDESSSYTIYKNTRPSRNNKDKWFAVIMHLPFNTVNKSSHRLDIVEVMNIKVKPDSLEDLLKIDGIYEAYHMNKKHWVSVVLDGTIDNQSIFELIDNSYTLVSKKK